MVGPGTRGGEGLPGATKIADVGPESWGRGAGEEGEAMRGSEVASLPSLEMPVWTGGSVSCL